MWSARLTSLEESPRNDRPLFMFVGAINSDLRSIVAALAPSWRGLPVYVGCSGAYTIERVLSQAGIAEIHSNDVSLYSCAIGHYLAVREFPLAIADERLAWLEPFLEPGPATISTLLLLTTMMQFWERDNPFHRRMWEAHRARFADLHAKTLAKMQKAFDGVRLRSFFAGDVVDFLTSAPDDSVVAAFPPTYRAGYERLYKKLHAAFEWPQPTYQLFTEERFGLLVEAMKRKRVWLVSRDAPIPSLEDFQIGLVQTGVRTKPVYVYSNQGRATLTQPHQRLDPVAYPRVQDTIFGRLTIIPLTHGQINTLRSEYLSPTIAPGRVWLAHGVLVGDRLAGALAWKNPDNSGLASFCDVYLLTDLAVASPVRRLSKLVLAAALSTEMQTILEERYCRRVERIGTTAFTDKPVSMKYRGLFELHSRKPGQLNYVARAGRWSLEEGLDWWTKTQSQTSTP